ncbi:CvpA family protein [Rhodoferax sp.]|uniref:CvpA family protein n=1 Tax=Rhodoferax sp. TaxID=50421 RepID=UPI00374CD33D
MPFGMATLDWAVLAVLFLSLLLGAWRGLVFEVLSVLGWIAAFFAAQWFAGDVAGKLPLGQASASIRYAAAFVLVFIAAAFAAGLLASLVKTLVQAVGLRPVDRVLGALFGLLRGVILVLIGAVIVHMTGMHHSAWWHESRSAGVLTDVLHTARPMLPEALAKFL